MQDVLYSTTAAPDTAASESNAPPRFPDTAWPGVFASYYDLVAPTCEASDAFIWASATGMLSTLFAPGVGMAWGSQILKPTLYLLLLGATGRTRKTTAMQDARRILLDPFMPRPRFPGDPERITVLSGFASGEGMADALSDQEFWPPGKKKGEGPPEVATGRCALFEFDEFASQLMKSNKDAAGNFTGMLLRLWDLPPTLSLRTRREQVTTTNPLAVILAASTYSFMGRALSQGHIRDGVLNRFLLVHGEPGKAVPVRPAINPQDHMALMTELHQALTAVWGRLFTLSPGAEAVHTTLYCNDHQQRRESDLLEAATSRASIMAIRLAVLFAAARGSTVISDTDMQGAWDVMTYNQAVVARLLQSLQDSTWREAEARVQSAARREAAASGGTFTMAAVRARLKGGNGLDARTFNGCWMSMVRAGDFVAVAEGSDRYCINEEVQP
ncbi:DUF3987 domain-containing protein [Myxococcus sp. RHSTA-1-4]|uniref:DUF3987 domain-containing protein n=1 Tax=Myxococcus sp. RHSTA-1-4 TaxID=2874601 RepID=UPI001CC04E40|nr:DUF3987 domain-containing protein [Myxococcus sp. RHSTA-1-4]MBZ4421754.1 DUF3987 domain-containing protein [Myxococcus sp. RHSTA-1-4]